MVKMHRQYYLSFVVLDCEGKGRSGSGGPCKRGGRA